jgi:hypothetical protein
VFYRKRTFDNGVRVQDALARAIKPFEGSRFVRGGRYGISIDFFGEVIEKEGVTLK